MFTCVNLLFIIASAEKHKYTEASYTIIMLGNFEGK